MKNITLRRVLSNQKGTLGVLVYNEIPFLLSLERPANDNQADSSDIPAGSYLCEWHNSPHFGLVYRLAGVPGRSEILIHPGNMIDDTHGCILLGRGFGALMGESIYISESKLALEKLYSITNKESFMLEIQDKAA